MSSIPSTTASLYGGHDIPPYTPFLAFLALYYLTASSSSLPSKPEHSLTALKQDSSTLRASRLKSFLFEPPSEGNFLAPLTGNEASTSTPSKSASGLDFHRRQSVADSVDKVTQALKNTHPANTASTAAKNPSNAN
jgi:hypothetical protein